MQTRVKNTSRKSHHHIAYIDDGTVGARLDELSDGRVGLFSSARLYGHSGGHRARRETALHI